jgi:hypothetical protein
MADAPQETVPVVNSQTVQSVIRNVAQALTGALITRGVVNGDQKELVISAVVGIATLAWSLYSSHSHATLKANS